MSRLLVFCFFLVAAVCLCQGAPRQKRGFRNAALSTARGFGKRMQPSEVLDELSGHNDFTRDAQKKSVTVLSLSNNYWSVRFKIRPIASSWLADQVQRSPALAKLLVEKVLDQNGDGLINPEEMFQTLQ